MNRLVHSLPLLRTYEGDGEFAEAGLFMQSWVEKGEPQDRLGYVLKQSDD